MKNLATVPAKSAAMNAVPLVTALRAALVGAGAVFGASVARGDPPSPPSAGVTVDYVQQFGPGGATNFNLQFKRIMFQPIEGGTAYDACIEDITAFNSDPAGGHTLSLGYHEFAPAVLDGGATVRFYDERTHLLFISNGGYVTFGEGDTDTSESLAEHFALPRVSGLYDNLNPAQGGSVTWRQFADRVAITWLNVPEMLQGNDNSVQIEMYFDGRIAISFLNVDAIDGLVGLSPGYTATPDPIVQTDFLALPACSTYRPIVEDFTAHTCPNTPVEIELAASDDGAPGALSFRIESLPANGTLTDPGTGAIIATAPHVLGQGGSTVRYEPDPMHLGADAFTFSADDGGTAPNGGASDSAAVSIAIGGPHVAYYESLNDDPGWVTTGDWAFGQPLGMGSGDGDPFAGATGANVFGNNLSGNYPSHIPGPPNAYTLTAGPVDCSDLTGVQVVFERWLGVQHSSNDTANFLVSSDGVNYVVVWQHLGPTFNDGEWIEQSFDISALADGEPTVYLRWSLGPTDGSTVLPGWNVDDVRLLANSPSHACLGDVDGDNDVDFGDLNIVVGNINRTGAALAGDLNCDGAVNFEDLNVVISRINTSCR